MKTESGKKRFVVFENEVKIMILARKSIVGPVTLCSVPPPGSHCSE